MKRGRPVRRSKNGPERKIPAWMCIQGIPDLLILYNNRWATLENKRSKKAHKQPNQEYYVNKMDEMSFSRFIYPENKEQIMGELESYLKKE